LQDKKQELAELMSKWGELANEAVAYVAATVIDIRLLFWF
jgi:hypothetical protein